MIIYSKKIIQYIHFIKITIKKILTNDVGLAVFGERFYDKRKQYSYPIKVVIFNNKKMLGYFDPNFFEIGIHECLMHSNQDQLQNIIKHELAHYLTFITYGAQIQAHGPEFKSFCQSVGWGENVYSATTCLDDAQEISVLGDCSVLRKIQKLMALSTSSNKFEAEQAMLKSRELLLKHHVDSKAVDESKDEKMGLKRIMKQKKISAKMRAIANILSTFFVNIVYNRTKEHIYLEILGSSVNIEIAEYVTEVLDNKFDDLWTQAQKQSSLKGIVAKNSFFLGIAKGYCNKIDALKREHKTDIMNALVTIEKNLEDAKSMVYNKLSSTRSSGYHCPTSAALGEKMGRQLNINPAVNDRTNSHTALITN